MKIELSHDILARKIYEKASAEDKMILKIEQLVSDNYMRYRERNVLMSREDYDYIAPFLSAINISEHEQEFIDKSIAAIRRKQRMLNLLILSAIIILTIFGGVASFQSFQAQQRAVAIAKQNLALNAKSDSLMAQSEEINNQRKELEIKQKELRAALEVAVQKEQEAEAAATVAAKAAREAQASAREARTQKVVADSLRIEAERQTVFALYQRAIADSLKDEAVKKTKIAEMQTARADSLLGLALLEKARGDTLRGLSEARVLANKAIRMIQEGKLLKGAELSLYAHELNDSIGGPYQNADCYAALDLAYQSFLDETRSKLSEREISQLYKPHNAAIRCIDTDYSKKRKTIIAYATEDEQIYVVDTFGYYKLKIRVPLANDEIKPRSIALSHDGNLLIVGTYSGHLMAYEYTNGRYTRLQMPYNEYKGAISYIQIVEPVKGAYYIAFADKKNVHLGYISIQSNRNQFSKELSINIQNKFELGGIKTASFSKDGRYLVVVNNGLALLLQVNYNFPKLNFSASTFKQLPLGKENVTASAITKGTDGRYLVALGLKNGSIRIADFDNLNCLMQNDNCEFEAQAEHKSAVTKLIFNQNGDQLISSSLDKTAKIWNINSISEDRIPLIGHREWIWDIAYNESQDEIFTVSEDRFIKTWISRSDILAKKIKVESYKYRRRNSAPRKFRGN